MFCPKCGTRNEESVSFCRSCGVGLTGVTQALSGANLDGTGSLEKAKNPMDKEVSFESGITKLLTGVAFLIIAAILGITGVAGGRVWWFWMLIPAFTLIGTGVARFVQLRAQNREKELRASETGAQLNSAQSVYSLPQQQTDFISPESRYKTGDLVPPSVTDSTTKLLKVDTEGETTALPKK